MLEIILISFLGISIGVIIGLLPGMNINNILPLILSATTIFHSPHYIAALIVSIAITQIFISYIPSIFLGAPSEDTSLSVLPGHKMLLEGRGYEAIKLTIIGGLCSLFLTTILIFSFSNYFIQLYYISRPYIAYVIILVIALMVLTERKVISMLFSLFIIFLSGIFGLIVLNSSIFSQQNILFPILSGMFGMSTLILSISEKSKIPKQQNDEKININKLNLIKCVILGSLAGIAVGFLPAIGVSQAATMAQYLIGMNDARNFLVTLSGINVANELFSINSLYLVSNPRSGSSVAIERILNKLSFNDMLLLTGVICFASGIAAFITLYIGNKIPNILVKIDYKKLSLVIILFLSAMVIFSTGLEGLVVFIVSTSIGILCAKLNVRRSNCMGVFLLPSLTFFLGINPMILSLLGI
jgi:putative membrane protein